MDFRLLHLICVPEGCCRNACAGDFEFDSDDDVEIDDDVGFDDLDDADELGRRYDASEGAVADAAGAMINTGQVDW